MIGTEKLINKIEKFRSIVKDEKAELSVIKEELKAYETAGDTIVTIEREMIPYEKELSIVERCPTCGKSMYVCMMLHFMKLQR